MDKFTYFIGIDVSKSKLDICVSRDQKIIFEACIENTLKALTAFKKRIQKMNILPENTLFCCEHTGIYVNNLITWTDQCDYKLWIENALQIKKSIGLQRGKNDSIDAQRIAMYAFRYQDKAVIFQQPRKVIEELKHLLTTRQRLVKTKKQLKVPLQELKTHIDKSMYKNVDICSQDSIKGIEKSLKKIDHRIEQIVKQDEKLTKTVGFATSVHGVGMITATSIIAYTNEFKGIQSGKQLACYVGVVPFAHRSGSSIQGKSRVSHLANKSLKTLLHMCAISAKTHSSICRAYYERKIADGKHKMAVINAIRHKIVRRIYACVSNQRMYEENYPKLFA